MPTSLTATKIKDTYGQILHVDGGITSTPKLVYDGDGTATVLKLSTTDVQVNNSPVLTDADIGSSVQAYDSTILKASDIGSTVQAYDSDLTAWSGKTAPTGTVVGTSDSQALSNKSFGDNPVLSAGTANGVAYLNGSKVLTTGSALTFDGTNLATTGGFTATGNVNTSGNYYLKTAGTKIGWDVSGVYFNWIESGGTAGADYLRFGISNAEQMRLTSTGLGIGTSSPGANYKLEVSGNNKYLAVTTNTGYGGSVNPSGTSGLFFGWNRSNGDTESSIVYGKYSGINSYLQFAKWDGTTYTEQMRIDSSGNLLVGTTSAIGTGFSIQNSSQHQIWMRNSAQPSGQYVKMGVESSSGIFTLYTDTSGGVYLMRGATSWSGNSDERLKTNLEPIKDAANKVSTLRALTGRFKTDDEGVSRAFLIAQDVQDVLPEAVDVRDDEQGTLGIRYTDVIPLLVAAIKELKAELDATKAEVAALKGK